MSTPAPASPPFPFRRPRPCRPVPPLPLAAAPAADGSRCVTRDPETSRPTPPAGSTRTAFTEARSAYRTGSGRRTGGPLPLRVVLRIALFNAAHRWSTP